MAEEEKKEEGAQPKKSGNLLMIILVVLIVLLLAAVGGLGYFLYSKGIFSDQPQDGSKAKQEKKEESSDDEEAAQNFLAKIEGLVLNVTDAKGRPHLMKLSFSIQSTEPTIAQLVEDNKDQITDTVIHEISSRSTEELLTVAGKDQLKNEMLNELNLILNENKPAESEVKPNCIKNIFFTSFVLK